MILTGKSKLLVAEASGNSASSTTNDTAEPNPVLSGQSSEIFTEPCMLIKDSLTRIVFEGPVRPAR